ncbi:MAG: trypsin-like peptidase domain-containing protein [Armatimonadota bacterium]
MKTYRLLPFLILLISSCVWADSVQESVDRVLDEVRPALVRIHVVSSEDYGGREVKMESFGSGAIISPEGHVVTNHHVAGHSRQITCTLADRTECDAVLVGTDPGTDIAVIKLCGKPGAKFPYAKFGDSSTVRVGESVFAMGCPLALSQSVTMGIVSNTEMTIPRMYGGLEMDGEDVGSLVRWIGHDAPIRPGNSGGPLISMQGEIIGINEISLGLSGAIPSNIAANSAEQLIASGSVKRGWIGMAAQPLLKCSGKSEGVLVGGTLPGSPAEKADIRPGDILLSINGEAYTACFDEEIPIVNQAIARLAPGKKADLLLARDGKEIKVSVTPIEKPVMLFTPSELLQWGICAKNLSYFDAKSKKRAGTEGVLVTSIRPGGPADDAKPSLSGDDVIVSVNGKPVGSIEELQRMTAELAEGKSEPVPVLVAFERGAEQYITVVKVGKEKAKDPGLEVRKAWLPAATQVLTRDIAEVLGIGGTKGVRVTQVYSGCENLRVGDIITALDGAPIPASEPGHVEVFPAMVRQYKVGSEAELTVRRDGEVTKVKAKLLAMPELAREMKSFRDENFDFTVRDICFFDRVAAKWPEDQQGVLLTAVESGGWAALGGLGAQNLILAVDDHIISNVEQFETLMSEISKAKPESLVMRIRDGISDSYIEIKPIWPN